MSNPKATSPDIQRIIQATSDKTLSQEKNWSDVAYIIFTLPSKKKECFLSQLALKSYQSLNTISIVCQWFGNMKDDGHNPSMKLFVEALCNIGAMKEAKQLSQRYPACEIALAEQFCPKADIKELTQSDSVFVEQCIEDSSYHGTEKFIILGGLLGINCLRHNNDMSVADLVGAWIMCSESVVERGGANWDSLAKAFELLGDTHMFNFVVRMFPFKRNAELSQYQAPGTPDTLKRRQYTGSALNLSELEGLKARFHQMSIQAAASSNDRVKHLLPKSEGEPKEAELESEFRMLNRHRRASIQVHNVGSIFPLSDKGQLKKSTSMPHIASQRGMVNQSKKGHKPRVLPISKSFGYGSFGVIPEQEVSGTSSQIDSVQPMVRNEVLTYGGDLPSTPSFSRAEKKDIIEVKKELQTVHHRVVEWNKRLKTENHPFLKLIWESLTNNEIKNILLALSVLSMGNSKVKFMVGEKKVDHQLLNLHLEKGRESFIVQVCSWITLEDNFCSWSSIHQAMEMNGLTHKAKELFAIYAPAQIPESKKGENLHHLK
ncbi:hypothetical protein D5R81_09550 [Parashewanella spongiae]|uniref:Uncharacterized protein n=2 Tax=Parashewanella spongiae TaxID=342950 RepID=A0A3A6U3H1_9GAMM|nr:hypothetical protein D5R81_09550 [Parashewanella spongiae]